MEIFEIVTLSLSGLLLFFVGSIRLSNPIKAYEKNTGIKLDKNADLLNEMRGVSAVMLCGAIIIGLGIAMDQLTLTSFVVASLLFLGFAIGRIISIGADGKPNQQIIQGLGFEIVLGGMNAFCLIRALV